MSNINFKNPKEKIGKALRKIEEYKHLYNYEDRINNYYYNVITNNADAWAKHLRHQQIEEKKYELFCNGFGNQIKPKSFKNL